MVEVGSRCLLVLLGTKDMVSEIEATIESDLGTQWRVTAAGASFAVPKEWVKPAPRSEDNEAASRWALSKRA